MQKIIIKDKNKLNETIANIKKDGIESLHIVADFDNTLTKAYINGEKALSVIGQIRKQNLLGEKYTKKAYALYDKYHPIEIDPEIPNDDKNKYMVEWWQTNLKYMIEYGMNKSVVEKLINCKELILRRKSTDLIKLLKEKNIPILILSAAIGDVIVGILEKEKCNFDNIHIISNFYDYDTEGKVKGYKGQIIHSFNKDETEIKLLPHYQKIKERKNIILIGDNLGDLEMSNGIEFDNIIKIGFYNNPKKEENFDEFQEGYDILILNDGSMKYILDLLKEIGNITNLQ